MFNDDPLTNWLTFQTFNVPAKRIATIRAALRDNLITLTTYLKTKPQKGDFSNLNLSTYYSGALGFSPADLEQAQDAYLHVVRLGGKSSRRIEEELLFLMGTTARVATIPYWQSLLDLQKTRDMMRTHRQQMALAAIAFCAIMTQDTAVYKTLHQLTHHDNPDIRAQAIYYLSRAYTEAEMPIPDNISTDMIIVAREDSHFEPRFQARRILRLADLSIPLDNPDGVYDLKVTLLAQPRTYRTISVRAQQTLADLQRFIQHAFDWDNDHLFTFYMNGRKYDDQYRYSCAYEESRPPWAYEVQIGQLGLVKKHTFLYHFDYGDDHLFEIKVQEIRPNIRTGNYPRIIDSYGKAPHQYY